MQDQGGCGDPCGGQVGVVVMSVGSHGPFEAGDAEACESEFDSLCIEIEALKREVRTMLDTMRCASDVLTKLIEETK